MVACGEGCAVSGEDPVETGFEENHLACVLEESTLKVSCRGM